MSEQLFMDVHNKDEICEGPLAFRRHRFSSVSVVNKTRHHDVEFIQNEPRI